ncbi:MAG: hypothetical protein H7Y11_15065, partial [Armatimonadetes bacterium]|nr:hypothetical protein [Anaerolineae bacterium]
MLPTHAQEVTLSEGGMFRGGAAHLGVYSAAPIIQTPRIRWQFDIPRPVRTS